MATAIRGANNGVGVSQIKAGTISNADIHSSAAIALSKLATAVIAADGSQAFTADQSMGSFKLTNLADPVSAQDAATKAYVDSISAGLNPKAAVRLATLADLSGTYSPTGGNNNTGTLTFANGPTHLVDGVSVVAGDRILVKNQTDAKQNGIYVVNSVQVPSPYQIVLYRATDMDGSPTNEVAGGDFTFIQAGSQAGQGWVLLGDGILTLNTDNISWTQFSASTGVTVSGTTNRITVTGGPNYTVDIAATYVGQTSITTLGTITTGTWNATTIDVAYGGTGATTFTANGVLYGNGTGAIQATGTGFVGSILLASAGAPAFSAHITASESNTVSTITSNSTSSFTIKSAVGAIAELKSSDAVGATSGNLVVHSGDTGTSGNTGSASFYSGSANGSTGTSGAVGVYSGETAGTGATGAVSIYSGNATGAGDSGNLILKTGSSTATVGSILLYVNDTTLVATVNSTGLNLSSGKVYQINGTTVLSNNTLGSGVVTSSLTSVGTLTTGTWNATTIGTQYGGTGLAIAPTSIADGEILIGDNATDAFVKTTITAGSGISILNGAGSITISSTGSFGASNIVTEETPSGSVDGSNVSFIIANTPYVGSVRVYLNGLRQKSGGVDYSISGTTITFVNAPQTGDELFVDYFK